MKSLARRGGFLDTRVGRRTLANFLTAAMLPVLVSSLTGIWFVRRSLENEAIDRVQRTSKSVAMIVINRLNYLAEPDARRESIAISPVLFTRDDSVHLAQSRPLLRLESTATRPDNPSLVFLRRLPDGQMVARTTTAEAFWSALDENTDLDRTAICLYEVGSWRRVFCGPDVSDASAAVLRLVAMSDTTPGGSPTLQVQPQGAADRKPKSSGNPAMGTTVPATVGEGDEALLVARRDVFLRFELGAPEWRLVTAESRAAALAPARSVTSSLLLLIGLALVSAFMLAHHQIRRSTEPLEALRSATRRVEEGDLATPVIITTRDEYSDLGAAFNGMTGALSRQLSLLHRMDAVDDATLRDRRISAIALKTLQGFAATSHCRNPSVAIRDDATASLRFTQWWTDVNTGHMRTASVTLTALDRSQLCAHPRHYRAHAHATGDGLAFAAGRPAPDGARVVLPLLHDHEVLGAITFDASAEHGNLNEDIAAIRRIADRVALGASNVRLLGQLDAMSTGALRAFARAIDANSAWTRGHSERVTHLALALGKQLDLRPRELSTLYRGGLMHDVGKIGVPATILDKAGRLTAEERLIIEQHPEIGARILAPIPGFADALPIVRSHHERFDGQGYPDKLAGQEIPWLARVLSVADVFDAMASDRPYRDGLSHRAAISMIEAGSGTAFDPRVVDALLHVESTEALTCPSVNLLEEYTVAGLDASRATADRRRVPIDEAPLATV